ncbi:MAG: NAD(P)-binding domain-containing protein [Hyphomicrobiales bacterium]|nr:NAD(P)-binding domain-containing protein [Hyphomicrobiales bacterium]MBV8768907.1 NAD(P)-binding domain-containing protein [Hyphomicrobiales bacterium]
MAGLFSLARRREFLKFALGGTTFVTFSAPFAGSAQTMAGEKMKIATIGAGREGGALGTLFAKAGHPVMFSSRKPDELKDLVASAGPSARAGTVAEAVEFGEVVLLVVPYGAIEQIGKDYGKSLAAKPLVIDVSNPIARRDGDDLVKSVEQQGGPGLVTAKLVPGVHLVRGFNAINFAALAKDANRSGDPLGIPIAGDDQNAIELASRLIKGIGFEAVLVGGLAKGKYLVPGTPLGGEHSPAEIREIASKLS